MHRVHSVELSEHGHLIKQDMFAYEVHLTFKKEDDKWRSSRRIMVICRSVEEAVRLCKIQYPADPVIDQVVLRNTGMEIILSAESLDTSEAVICSTAKLA